MRKESFRLLQSKPPGSVLSRDTKSTIVRDSALYVYTCKRTRIADTGMATSDPVIGVEKGEIAYLVGGCYQWTIRNFGELWENRRYVLSPIFTFLDEDYGLSLMNRDDSGMIHVRFYRTPNVLPLNRLRFEFQIRTECHIVSDLHAITLRHRSRRFPPVIIDFSEFLTEVGGPPIHDSLRILFQLRESSDGENFPDQLQSLLRLQEDFEKLFLDPETSDLTLKVQDEEIPAHKAVLLARSPVFCATFRHEIVETHHNGVAVIHDCDPKTFQDFLRYLYTGSAEHINEENVCRLYRVSDAFEVEVLRAECTEFMKNHVSVETFCDFIALARNNYEDSLVRAATDFFCANAAEVMSTSKWLTFFKGNLTFSNNLCREAVSRREFI